MTNSKQKELDRYLAIRRSLAWFSKGLGRHQATIYRKVWRNSGKGGYRGFAAPQDADEIYLRLERQVINTANNSNGKMEHAVMRTVKDNIYKKNQTQPNRDGHHQQELNQKTNKILKYSKLSGSFTILFQ
jgi:IS30 family transposase